MDQIVLHVRGHVEVDDGLAGGEDGPLAQTRSFLRHHRKPGLLTIEVQDGLLRGQVGIIDPHMHQEAVELGLRQGIGSLLLDGILGRHDQKEVRQPISLPTHRNLPLAHGLQQGGLHLGRGAIDLVGKEQIMKDGTLIEMEATILRTIDFGSREVRWQ